MDRSRGINNAAQQFTSNVRFGNERDLSLIPLNEYHTYSRKGENRWNNSPLLLEDREAKWTKRNEIRLWRKLLFSKIHPWGFSNSAERYEKILSKIGSTFFEYSRESFEERSRSFPFRDYFKATANRISISSQSI